MWIGIIVLWSITQASYNGKELLSQLIETSPNISYTPVLYKWLRKDSEEYRLVQQAIENHIILNKNSYLWLKSEFTRDSVRLFVLKNFDIDLEIYGPEALDTETRQWIIDTLQVHIDAEIKEHQQQINNTIVTTIQDYSIKGFSGSTHEAQNIIKELGDPYTNYLTWSDQRLLDQMLHGMLVGIGVMIHKPEDTYIRISKVLSSSPAIDAGLQANDRIIAIDNYEITASDSLSSLTNRIQWLINTSVTLTIQRWDKIFKKTIKRKVIKIEPIQTEELSNDTLLVSISTFQVGIYEDFKKLLPTFEQYENIIIDLRDNGGWSLEDTRMMLNHIVPRKSVIYYTTTKDKKTEIVSKWVSKTRSLTDKHITFLINQHSASASEIFAGVAKEYGTHTRIIWTKSYGKWSIQSIRTYDDGSLLKVTTAYRSLWKSDTSIQDKWITPDYVITDDHSTAEDEVIAYALKTS